MKGRDIQGGMGAVMIVAMLLLLGLAGAYMATSLTTSSQASAVTFNGIQAHFAARSGMEWAVRRVLTGGCGAATPTPFSLGRFTVDLTLCTTNAVSEGSSNYTVYDLEVTASRGTAGSTDYVRRTLHGYVTDAP